MKKNILRLGGILIAVFVLLAAGITTTQAASIRELFMNTGFNPNTLPVEIQQATPSSSANELEFKATVEAIRGDLWTIGGQVIRVSASTVLERSPGLGSFVEVKALRQADGSWLAVRIHTEDGMANNGSMIMMGNELEFYGTVQAISGNTYTINGYALTVNSATMLDAGVRVGSFVEAKAYRQADGTWLAVRIHLEDSPGSLDDNSGSNNDDSDDHGGNSGPGGNDNDD